MWLNDGIKITHSHLFPWSMNVSICDQVKVRVDLQTSPGVQEVVIIVARKKNIWKTAAKPSIAIEHDLAV